MIIISFSSYYVSTKIIFNFLGKYAVLGNILLFGIIYLVQVFLLAVLRSYIVKYIKIK